MIKSNLSIIEYTQGYIKIQEIKNIKINKQEIQKKLKCVTDLNWVIESEVSQIGINYRDKEQKELMKQREAVINNPMIQKILKSFAGIQIDDIKLSDINNKINR